LRQCLLADPTITEALRPVDLDDLIAFADDGELDAAVIVLSRERGIAVVPGPELEGWAYGVTGAVSGVVLGWDAATDELRALVRLAAGAHLPNARASTRTDLLHELTDRELETLALLGLHGSATGVADALGISAHTVRTHIGHILSKLKLHTRLEAVSYARRSGLSSLGERESA
jgi:DNA-binding CsgD family transcriptional regulator